MNRRNLIIAAGALPLVAPILITTTRASEDVVDFLFVQNAGSVSLDGGVLTLTAVAASTLYFSDRPERIVGHVQTSQFVDSWNQGPDSFKADPPNATLAVLSADEPKETVVVLKDPQLREGNLSYQVDVLEGEGTLSGGPCALFIDVIGRPLSPLSFAGTARRTSRRTARRVTQTYSSAPAAAPQESVEQRLSELDNLAQGGYITPEEYKAKKQAILDDL